jgi:formamidopyrimidine-DNA glycosylase
MPELPDITVYVEALSSRIRGVELRGVRISSPFVLRSFEPPIEEAVDKQVIDVLRIGKRIAIALQDDLYLVIHLMIAGRLHWKPPGAKLGGKINLAALDFPNGTLTLTEASKNRRASIRLVRGSEDLHRLDRGGIEVLDADLEAFRAALLCENHTLKRSLTDPRLFSGIGNAYSDEILHRARLSPVRLTRQLSDPDIATLYEAVRATLIEWTDLLRRQTGDGFPEKVTAFRPEMAVHGRYEKPCPVCGAPVQRIRYAENETNYCARCQTGGKLLADRGLSRLLKGDWPRSLDELEEGRFRAGRNAMTEDPQDREPPVSGSPAS